MRFFAYVILIFAICTSMYYLGYTPVGYEAIGAKPVKIDPNCEINASLPQCVNQDENKASVIGTILVVVLAISIFSALILGYSAIYVIPIFILYAVVNFFVLPTDFMMGVDVPLIKYPVLGLLNILCASAVVNFIRGNF